MPRLRGIHVLVCLAAVQFACSGSDWTELDNPGVGTGSAALRDMTVAEASEDLEQIFTNVRTLYGPYEYKEARSGYSIAELEDEARAMFAESPSDDGFYAAGSWFLSRLDDAHVGLSVPPDSNPINNYVIGIYLQPVDGKALIAELMDPSLAEQGVAFGDEVLAVDGASPFSLLEEFRKLSSLGNPLTNQHLIFHTFIRPGFAASIRPTGPTARVDFRRADGSEYSRDLIWREDRDFRVDFVDDPDAMVPVQQDAFVVPQAREINAYVQGSLASIGAPLPFFFTPATAATFEITPVTPNPSTLARYGLDPNALPDIFAGLYSYAGKNILLIRQAQYIIADVADLTARLNYYRAVLDQFDTFVDGLVVDQTHNPGGNVAYCMSFAQLFTETPGANFVQAYNTDRSWINVFRDAARSIDPTLQNEEALSWELRADRIEAAYDAGESISPPMPLFFHEELPPDAFYVWTKPRLVLIDELAGSCGDIFPMLVERNELAPLFGRRTMGAGGNVEAFGPLSNSRAPLRLTRGLFTTHREDETYEAADFIENNGVLPDIEHVITVPDYRAGFVDYMTHFSQVLVDQIDAGD